MESQPSTSAAASGSNVAARNDDDGSTSADEVEEAEASTSGSASLQPHQQDDERVHLKASVKQCKQLFGASCRVKLQRCEMPATPATESNAISSVAIPSSRDAPTEDSTTVAKVKDKKESDTESSSSSSSSEDELEAAPPTKKNKGKRAPHRKSSVQCKVCRKTLSSIQYLKIHMAKHSGKMGYKCENCGRSFWSPSSFANHKKARDQRNGVCPLKYKCHDGEWRPKGPWKCKICGERVKYASYYVAHMRSHPGSKPFKCEECGKAFGRSWQLTQHKRIHQIVWQYTCVFCNRGFNFEYNFFYHLRGHTEEKPYFCMVKGCGASFRLLKPLQHHHRLVHLKKKN